MSLKVTIDTDKLVPLMLGQGIVVDNLLILPNAMNDYLEPTTQFTADIGLKKSSLRRLITYGHHKFGNPEIEIELSNLN